MVHARLTCSDDQCTEVYEAYGALEEIAALACECGCGMEIIGWPDPLPETGNGERPQPLLLIS